MPKATTRIHLHSFKFRVALWLCHRYSEAFALGKNDEDGKNKKIRARRRKQRKEMPEESERCSASIVGKDRPRCPAWRLMTVKNVMGRKAEAAKREGQSLDPFSIVIL